MSLSTSGCFLLPPAFLQDQAHHSWGRSAPTWPQGPSYLRAWRV